MRVVVALGFCATIASAQTILYVDDDAPPGGDGLSWPTAFKDLQRALAVADAINEIEPIEIRVAEGIYRPAPRNGDRTATFRLLDNTAIRGGFAGLAAANPDENDVAVFVTVLSGDLNDDDTPVACTRNSRCAANGGLCADDGFCIIAANNAENSYNVVTGSGTIASATLDGFTITAGHANGSCCGNELAGGGMFNTDRGSPTVTHCTISGNSALVAGGGMANGGGSPVLANCTFHGNSGGSFAGGMLNVGSSPTMTNCTFSHNSAPSGGGIINRDGGNPTMRSCTFRGNLANFHGGGMENVTCNPTITACTFSENSAIDNGGGMRNAGSSPTLTDCTFIGNSAGDGGGIYNANNSSPTLTNCTFSGNSAGGMLNASGSSPVLTNCILWGNVPTQIHTDCCMPVVNYSTVQGGWSGAGGRGNIAADPLFANPDGPDNIPGTDDDDLRLLADSPAINNGDPSLLYDPGEHDLDGHARVLCGRVDMGAYEFGIGDFDCNRDVDLFDFASWADCFTGPGGGPLNQDCEDFDFDGDLDVDLIDFAGMQVALSAP